MIDATRARRLVSEHIGEGRKTCDGITPAILDDKTIEKGFGWVFFYDAKEYVEGGDFRLRMLGNAPIIVDRRDGSLHVTGTAEVVTHYIDEYERKLLRE